MPANIAHILIAHEAYKRLEQTRHEIWERILSKNNHYYLGSLGPDLPSYKTSELVRQALNQLLIRPFVDQTNPKEEDASFYLHSIHPNLLPFYLMETNMSFADFREGKHVFQEFNHAVYAFTLGYVCHIAADQVIHRLVREIAGPYYKSLAVSQKHADCEVHQDIFLFHHVYPERVFSKTMVSELINIEKLGFEYNMFCNLLSLAMRKAEYERVAMSDIDGWFDGIKLTFDLMDQIGPYVNVIEDYEKQKSNLSTYLPYRQYFKDESTGLDYLEYYEDAITLALRYIEEIATLWENPDFSPERLAQYQSSIHADDLTSPFRDLIAV